jgi:hypothetical protein
MFRCEICGTVVGPRVAQKKKVVETKEVVHHDVYVDKDGRTQHKNTPGVQIVKEMSVCSKCKEM